MKKFIRAFIALLFLVHSTIIPNGQNLYCEDGAGIPSLTSMDSKDNKIYIQMSQLMPFDVFLLESPWRLVVEIPDTKFAVPFNKKTINSGLVNRIRGYQFKETPMVSRVIVDLAAPVDFKSEPNDSTITISIVKNDILDKQTKEPSIQSKPASRRSAKKVDLLSSLPKEVVTLDFEGADIKDVVRLMSETSNINMIYGPEVTGNITIHLRQVPFDEAFKTILNLKGLVAAQLGTNIIRITTSEILQKDRAKAILITKSIPVNYMKAQDMQGHLQSVMQTSGRKGTITVVPEENSLVITDSEEGIQQSEILIAQLDKRPRQVMIESRIVELNLNNGFDMGVQWEYYKQNISGDPSNGGKASWLGTGAYGSDTAAESARLGATIDGKEYGANTPPGGTGVNLPGPSNAGIAFGFIKDNTILSAALSALVQQSKARILSSPKVVTVNGQMAKIEAVQDIPFRTSTVSGSGVVSNSFKTVSAGIILTVTPTINAENRITLKIKPESSFPTQESTEAGPIIRSRNAQTTVIVKDGDTLVIGGLIDDSDTKGVTKVPLLGDIPIIGIFFRSTTERKQRNELLVFVTPRIIKD